MQKMLETADDVEETIQLAPDDEFFSAILATLFQMEECTGQVSVLLSIYHGAKSGKAQGGVLNIVWSSQRNFFIGSAGSLGMESNTWFKSLTLTLTLMEEDAGLTSSSLECLYIVWD
jgi:hypothetical protein